MPLCNQLLGASDYMSKPAGSKWLVYTYHQHTWEWFTHAVKINASTGKWSEIVRWSWIKICASSPPYQSGFPPTLPKWVPPHLTKISVYICIQYKYVHPYNLLYQLPSRTTFFLWTLYVSVSCVTVVHTHVSGVCMMSVCNCIVHMTSVCNCRVCMVSACKVL